MCVEAAAYPCHGNGEFVFYPDFVKIEFSFLWPDDGEDLMDLFVQWWRFSVCVLSAPWFLHPASMMLQAADNERQHGRSLAFASRYNTRVCGGAT